VQSRHAFMKQALGPAVLVSTAGCDAGSSSSRSTAAGRADGAVRSASAITQVFGDGLKLTAVALKYDKEIDSSRLSTATFTADGRTVHHLVPRR